MSLLQDVVAVIRLLPTELAELERRFVAWSQQVALAPHRPQDIGDGRIFCMRDKVPWPCPEWIRLTEWIRLQNGGDGNGGGGGYVGGGGSNGG